MKPKKSLKHSQTIEHSPIFSSANIDIRDGFCENLCKALGTVPSIYRHGDSIVCQLRGRDLKVKFLNEDDGVVVGVVDGPIHGVNALPDENLLGEVEGQCDFEKHVVLDISQTSSLDSSGISWLIRCHKRFSQHDGKIVFHSMQPMVQNVLSMMRLDSILHLASNQDMAVNVARGTA